MIKNGMMNDEAEQLFRKSSSCTAMPCSSSCHLLQLVSPIAAFLRGTFAALRSLFFDFNWAKSGFSEPCLFNEFAFFCVSSFKSMMEREGARMRCTWGGSDSALFAGPKTRERESFWTGEAPRRGAVLSVKKSGSG